MLAQRQTHRYRDNNQRSEDVRECNVTMPWSILKKRKNQAYKQRLCACADTRDNDSKPQRISVFSTLHTVHTAVHDSITYALLSHLTAASMAAVSPLLGSDAETLAPPMRKL